MKKTSIIFKHIFKDEKNVKNSLYKIAANINNRTDKADEATFTNN